MCACMCDLSFLVISFFVAGYARVVTTRLSCLERPVRKQWFVFAHWSFRCPCHVNWVPLYVTIKERRLKYKTNHVLSFQQREGCGQSFLLFFLFLFFFLTMAPLVLGRKIAHLFTYRKIVINFKSVELEHTPSSFPQSKRWSATVRSQKKKTTQLSSENSCFFTHNGITTPKTTREGQESTTKTGLHLAWPPKFKNQALFTPRPQNRFLFLDYFFAVAGRNLEACLAAWKSSIP